MGPGPAVPHAQRDRLGQGPAQGPAEIVPDSETPAHRVVVETPAFNLALGLSEIHKPLFIQARIPEFAIETLHQGKKWLGKSEQGDK